NRGDQSVGFSQKRFPGWCKSDVSIVSFKQLYTDRLLQFLNLPAEGRLSHIQLLCSLSEMEVLRHRNEAGDLRQCELHRTLDSCREMILLVICSVTFVAPGERRVSFSPGVSPTRECSVKIGVEPSHICGVVAFTHAAFEILLVETSEFGAVEGNSQPRPCRYRDCTSFESERPAFNYIVIRIFPRPVRIARIVDVRG